MGSKADRIEDPAGWTREGILMKAQSLHRKEAGTGNYDD
jgi:hypothetical protein